LTLGAMAMTGHSDGGAGVTTDIRAIERLAKA
jgi:hypothetical protein